MQYHLFILFALSIGAQAAPAEPGKDLDVFFKEKTKIENPLDLRDPFKAPPVRAGKKKEDGTGAKSTYTKSEKGEFANIVEAPLNEVDIYNIRVVGVLIGKERRAMIISGASTQVIIIKEGSKLGPDNAEVKAILPGGIILVEKIVNVYGQEEYLETVVPISK